MGIHIDGFIALAAHTLVIPQTKKEESKEETKDGEEPKTEEKKQIIKERKADVILAAYKSIQAAFRLLKPGNTNT